MVSRPPVLLPTPQRLPLPHLPFKPDFPQTSPIGSFLEGAAKGYVAEKSIETQDKRNALLEAQQKLDEQKAANVEKQTNIQAWNVMSKIMQIKDPAMRSYMVEQSLPLIGMDPKSDSGKNFVKMMRKASEDSRRALSQAAIEFGLQGLPASAMREFMDNPTAIIARLGQLQQARQQRELQNALTGAMGGDVTGAGGTGIPSAGFVTPLPGSSLSAAGAKPGDVVSPVSATPGTQPASSVTPLSSEQQINNLFMASGRALMVGTPQARATAGALLARARFIAEQSPDANLRKKLNEPIPADLASQLGVPLGTTLAQVQEVVPPSPEEMITRKTEATLGAKKTFAEKGNIPASMAYVTGLPKTMTVGEAGQKGYAIPDALQTRELASGRAFTKTAIENTNKLQAAIRRRPEAIGTSGSLAAAVNAIRGQALNFARAANIKVTAPLEPEAYRNTFQDIGISNRIIQSRVTSLAFAAAAAEGQTGRAISDKDVERFIRIIGADSQDPTAFLGVLEDFKDRLDRSYANRVQGVTGATPPSLLSKGRLIGIKPVDKMTRAERQAEYTRLQHLDLTRLSESQMDELERRALALRAGLE